MLFYEYFHGDNGAGRRRQPSDGLDRRGGEAAAAERGAEPLRTGRDSSSDHERLRESRMRPSSREWLETNGIGGFASSTIPG